MLNTKLIKLMQECRDQGVRIAYDREKKSEYSVDIRTVYKDRFAQEIALELFRAQIQNDAVASMEL